jgi:hypothetical protein
MGILVILPCDLDEFRIAFKKPTKMNSKNLLNSIYTNPKLDCQTPPRLMEAIDQQGNNPLSETMLRPHMILTGLGLLDAIE